MEQIYGNNQWSVAIVAKERLLQLFPSIDQAAVALLEELRSGYVRAVGVETKSPHAMVRKSSYSQSLKYICPPFWENIDSKDLVNWSWSQGVLASKNPRAQLSGGGSAWSDIRFEAVFLSEVGKPRSTRGRKRKPEWHDWIAAAVVLAINGGIEGGMTNTAVRSAIDAQLDEWNVGGLERNTVDAAITAILKRVRVNQEGFQIF